MGIIFFLFIGMFSVQAMDNKKSEIDFTLSNPIPGLQQQPKNSFQEELEAIIAMKLLLQAKDHEHKYRTELQRGAYQCNYDSLDLSNSFLTNNSFEDGIDTIYAGYYTQSVALLPPQALETLQKNPIVRRKITLRHLNLANNILHTIPPSVLTLTSLRSLDVRNTIITTIPAELVKLSQLSSFAINWEDIRSVEVSPVLMRSLSTESSKQLRTTIKRLRQSNTTSSGVSKVEEGQQLIAFLETNASGDAQTRHLLEQIEEQMRIEKPINIDSVLARIKKKIKS